MDQMMQADDNQGIPDDVRRDRLASALQAIAARLEAEANKRVGRRTHIEKRWIDDLLQYHGRYDNVTEQALQKTKKSKLFINLTKPKTDAMSAKLMDLLFPTDDSNWGIKPTPVPELTEAASKAAKAAREIKQQLKDQQEAAAMEQGAQNGVDPAQQQQMKMLQDLADQADRAESALNGDLEEARKRSDLMAKEIEDQLTESQYQAVMRDVIEIASKLGTGVCKGPVTGDKVRKGWKLGKKIGPDGIERAEFGLEIVSGENQPSMRYVDLWSFFPDMDARCIEEGEGNFERHLMNQKRLRGLAKLEGFDKDAIRRLLQLKPQTSAPAYIADLRNITGANDQAANDLYHVWEYTGCLDASEMASLALAMNDADTFRDMQDIDPLTEVNAVVWFCQGEILKFSIYPYDSGEPMYSVFNIAKDEASIFGYGVPYMIRDPQKAVNAGWRAMMDNGAFSSGPQIVVSQSQVEPADGNFELTPHKIWIAKEGIPRDKRAFETFDIPSNQAQLAGIITMARQFMDDTAQMPAIAQGEQGSGVTKTAQGMAILMNSANVVFRRIVKNFDDDVTTPNIRRFYDWNMQFNPKEEIKGDYSIDARGSSVLLVREMQAQNLMVLAFQIGGHPVYGPMLKNRDMLKKLFQANMVPADEVLLSDDEIDAKMAAAAAAQAAAQQDAPAGPDPELAKLQVELKRAEIDSRIEIENQKADNARQVAMINRDTQMMILAEKMNMNVDQLRAKLDIAHAQINSKERLAATEVAITERIGPSGGGLL